MMLKEFDIIANPYEDVLIQYFCNSLCLSIRAQLDERKKDQDMQNKTIKKTIDEEAKPSQQPLLSIQEINT